jgi:hypothetical protein
VSKTARPLRLVDSDLTPAWDVTFSIRGVDVPMRSPADVQADGDDGLFVAMVRAILPGAITRKLRRDCVALVPPSFASTVRSLTPAELLMLRYRYLGVQAALFAQASERAMRMASESFDHSDAARAIERPSPGARSPIERVSNALVSIRPGEPLPGWMAGGRVFGRRRDEGGNGGATGKC